MHNKRSVPRTKALGKTRNREDWQSGDVLDLYHGGGSVSNPGRDSVYPDWGFFRGFTQFLQSNAN
jgi:hypothetical protein